MKKRVSRRSFIKGAAVAAAGAISFPYFVSSKALGKGGSVAANDRVNIAFIGLGYKGFEGMWGALLPSFIADSNWQVRAVCDVDKRYIDRAKNYVDSYYSNNDCETYVDFRDIISRDDIDAVVIATPDHWHAVMTVMACKAGKDVYVEKPLSLTVDEAKKMVAAARKYGRVVQTGSQSRSNARLRFNCEAIRNGAIGDVKRITATSGGPPIDIYANEEPVPDYMLDWDLWVGPAPYRPYHGGLHPAMFRMHKDFAGGGTADWGAHHFDLIQWSLGMDDSGPVEFLPPDKDHEWLRFRYSNGVEVEHLIFDPNKNMGWGVNVYGSEGMIHMEGISGNSVYKPESIGNECDAEVASGDDLYSNRGHYENFLDCVRSRKLPVADVATGARSVTICCLANICYWLNRKIKWDPVSQTIVGDPEASRYLSRVNREPWRI